MSILDLQAEQEPIEVQTLKARFQDLVKDLETKTPGLSDALIFIHKHLQLHEELVHHFDDDDIAKLHKAHETYKQFAMIQKEVKKVGKSKKLTENDFANL